MRKLILFNMMTLDGYFEGPQHAIDWHVVDEEFNQFAIEQLGAVGMILFGRITYQMMASYWPTPQALSDDPIVAGKMNDMPKLVFSNTLGQATWQNTRLVKGEAATEVNRLKSESGKDLILFGSADLASSLTQHGLIDEYRVMLNPIILGNGSPLFKDQTGQLPLKLLQAKIFRSGNVLLFYQPK